MKTETNNTINNVCPYYTMFPLDFPLRIIAANLKSKWWIMDPFCGRGTTNFAARLLGRSSVGVDCSAVAVAIAKAKAVHADSEAVVLAARECIEFGAESDEPFGDFWELAYHPETLKTLSRVRKALLDMSETPARILLRAIILGALHGPLTKGAPSYFSNQCPRTFAPKPKYAVKFWRLRSLYPRRVDVIDLIRRRAKRYLDGSVPVTPSIIHLGDSKDVDKLMLPCRVSLVITSPPYYGMRTYAPDQWIRNWFLGGPSDVEYTQPNGSLCHRSPEVFASELCRVWSSVSRLCLDGAKLICRFGGINDRRAASLEIIKESLKDTPWRITTIKNAGTAMLGKRQASQFGERPSTTPRQEYDIHAQLS
jgi:DNA methylase